MLSNYVSFNQFQPYSKIQSKSFGSNRKVYKTQSVDIIKDVLSKKNIFEKASLITTDPETDEQYKILQADLKKEIVLLNGKNGMQTMSLKEFSQKFGNIAVFPLGETNTSQILPIVRNAKPLSSKEKALKAEIVETPAKPKTLTGTRDYKNPTLLQTLLPRVNTDMEKLYQHLFKLSTNDFSIRVTDKNGESYQITSVRVPNSRRVSPEDVEIHLTKGRNGFCVTNLVKLYNNAEKISFMSKEYMET